MSAGRIILVDDDAELRASTAQALDLAGFQVLDTDQPEEVPDLVGYGFPGIVVTDIRMPRLDGISLMGRIHALDRDLPVILITGHGDVQLAVRAMREGAHDFVEKPFSGGQLAETCARALDYRRLVLENRVLRAAAGQRDDLESRLPGRSNAMIDLRRRLRTIGPSETDVLIIGETGTGKEVVARALHEVSPRAAKPFVTIDCAALPETQIESELFGHEAGAFAGAMRARYGRFEHARGGTVLLDDIGSMPAGTQGKLLRVVQERVVTPLGSNEARPLDIRIIATSRAPLEPEVADVLGASDYLNATYLATGGQAVHLFVAFYDRQTDGAGIHSPEVCLPAGGWEVSALARHQILLPGQPAFAVNRAVIDRGMERQLVFYWFEQRGARMTNDFAVKFALVRDGLLTGRTDGALVRLVTPIAPSEDIARAEARLTAFLSDLLPELPPFVPGG